MRQAQLQAKTAVIAQKLGLPLADVLTGLRQVFGIKCPACAQATEVLRVVNTMAPGVAESLIQRMLEAKAAGDTGALAQLKEEFDGCRRSSSA